MRRSSPVVSLFLLAVATFGCRTPGSSVASVKDAADPSKVPVIAVIGGFNSCEPYQSDPLSPYGQAMWPKAKNLIDKFAAATGKTPRVLVTCYAVSGSGTSSKIDFRYAVAPAAFETMPVANAIEPLKTAQLAPVLAKIQEKITGLVAATGNGPIYVLGHSFGGWTSLQTALRFAATPKGFTTLFTVDPISPLNCNPSTYLNAIGLGSNPGCKHAPEDITTPQYTTINTKSGRWAHFYQVQFSLLHSSHIEVLEKNKTSFTLYLSSPNIGPNIYHSAIATDDRVWLYFARCLYMDYGLPQPANASLSLVDGASDGGGGGEDEGGVVPDGIDAYFTGELMPEPLPTYWQL